MLKSQRTVLRFIVSVAPNSSSFTTARRRGRSPIWPHEAQGWAEQAVCLAFFLTSLKNLIRRSLDDERKRGRGLEACCSFFFHDCRICPGLGFFDTVECNYAQALRRISIERREFLAADDVTAAFSLCFCRALARSIGNPGLECRSVVYFQDRNYNINRSIGLGVKAQQRSSFENTWQMSLVGTTSWRKAPRRVMAQQNPRRLGVHPPLPVPSCRRLHQRLRVGLQPAP